MTTAASSFFGLGNTPDGEKLTAKLTLCYPAHEYCSVGKAMRGYCLKYSTRQEMKNARSITMKKGKSSTRGVCATCGKRIFRNGKVLELLMISNQEQL